MPRFNQYDVSVDVDVDISVNEFLEECDEDEMQEVVSYVRQHYKYSTPLDNRDNIFDEEWNEIIEKLGNSRLQMSLEDIETIKQIYKKY